MEHDRIYPETVRIIRLDIGVFSLIMGPLDVKMLGEEIMKILEEFILNPYAYLAIAIISEVFGSSMLKVSNGFKKLFPSNGVVIGMGLAFYCLSLSLKTIPLGTAYAIWSGIGTALTALVGVIVYKEVFNLKKFLDLVLIIGGVVVLKLSSGDAH